MARSNQRGNIAFLIIIGAILTVILASGEVAAPVVAMLLSLYTLMALGILGTNWYRHFQEKLPEISRRRLKITPSARNAMELAHYNPYGQAYTLMDVGLIVDERRRGGLSLRRARLVSMDDESVRPYLVLHYPPGEYERQILIRFEISDAAGKLQFVYEMEHVLRSGENLIIADYRLPLRDNEKLGRTGTWDFKVMVQGITVGAQHFNVSPSHRERLKYLQNDGEADPSRLQMVQEEHDSLPLSIEELLRHQSH